MAGRSAEQDRLDMDRVEEAMLRLHYGCEHLITRKRFLAPPDEVARRARYLSTWHDRQWRSRAIDVRPTTSSGFSAREDDVLFSGPRALVPCWAWLAAAYMVYAMEHYGQDYESVCEIASPRVADMLSSLSRSPIEPLRPARDAQVSRLAAAPAAAHLVRLAEIDVAASTILERITRDPVPTAIERDAAVVWLRGKSAQLEVITARFADWPWWRPVIAKVAARLTEIYAALKRDVGVSAVAPRRVTPPALPRPVDDDDDAQPPRRRRQAVAAPACLVALPFSAAAV